MDGDENVFFFWLFYGRFQFRELSSLKTITEALKLSRDNHLNGKENKRNFELIKI